MGICGSPSVFTPLSVFTRTDPILLYLKHCPVFLSMKINPSDNVYEDKNVKRINLEYLRI